MGKQIEAAVSALIALFLKAFFIASGALACNAMFAWFGWRHL